jgi:hypothetical protein
MRTLSVITICFNNLADVQCTCASVDGQTRLPDEHWIINGSTTMISPHGSRKHRNPLTANGSRKKTMVFMMRSTKASPKPVGHNSYPQFRRQYAGIRYDGCGDDVFEKNKNIQWLSGKIQIMRGGMPVVIGKPFDKSKLYRGMRSVSHPTWFVKKEVYERGRL